MNLSLRRRVLTAAAILLAVAAVGSTVAPAHAAPVTVTNGTQFT